MMEHILNIQKSFSNDELNQVKMAYLIYIFICLLVTSIYEFVSPNSGYAQR